ncbi:unnamed protein product [Lathyrus sativus]|nr:unnamed protein product [Lathyrus sativus]
MEGFDQRGSGSNNQKNIHAFGSSSSLASPPKPPIQLNSMPINQVNQMGFPENHKSYSIGIPPSHPNTNTSLSPKLSSPYPQFMSSSQSQTHSRSFSQPTFLSLDSFSLPPLSPSLYPLSPSPFSDSGSKDVSMEENLVATHAPSPNRGHAVQHGHCLPPRKGHRRSSSDTPLGISEFVNSGPQSGSDRQNLVSGGEKFGSEKPIQLVLKDRNSLDGFGRESFNARKEDDAAAMDDLFSAYMNLENMNNMSFSGMEDSRTSGSKTVESSDNEAESHVKGISSKGATSSCSDERREGIKRSSNGDIVSATRHRRSFSLDGSIGNFYIEEGSPKLPPLQGRAGRHSPSNSMDSSRTGEIGMEFGKGEFSSEEMKKIMENDKLAEIALSDPKRAKRILANRLSAARSKERKTKYISELEHKVQTLQTETTTLSTQYTKLQMDHAELKNEHNEYKLRLQSLEQQSQLKDALNETLDAEVRRLRRTVADLGGESLLSSLMTRQLVINQQMLQSQQQQPNQLRNFQPQNSQSQEETPTQMQQNIQRNHEFQTKHQNGKTTA